MEQSRIAREEEYNRKVQNVSDLAKRIKETCKLGARDYKTAIKWILEADELKEDKDYQGDSLCFEFGIPFRHKKLFQLAGVA
jgi:pantothenate kinase-related protein Tda10